MNLLSRGKASLLVLAIGIAALLAAPTARAATSAIGLLDYSSRTPNFKNGDWVRYRFETATSNGRESVQYQVIRIVGEETFRGERCFWMETGVGRDTTSLLRTLMLVSYDAFKDPNADVRFKRYMRLMMLGGSVDNEGPDVLEVDHPVEEAPPSAEEIAQLRGKLDSLGVAKFDTPQGTIQARVTSLHRKVGVTDARPDSSIQTITETIRKIALSRRVPITSQVDFDQRENILRKAYKLGTVSTDAPENLLSWSTIHSRVDAWGTGAHSDYLDAWKKRGGLLAPKITPQ